MIDMNTLNILNKIFTNPYDDLSIFSKQEIEKLSFFEEKEKWYIKNSAGNEKNLMVASNSTTKPEEIVRQLFVNRLINKYKYPKDLISTEVTVNFGLEKKRADIVIYSDDKVTPYIVVEVKAPKEKNNVKQLKSYVNAEGAQIGVAINGLTQEILYRPYPKDYDALPDIPEYKQSIDDVYSKKLTFKELQRPKQLKQVIENLEDLVLANSGFDSFDEIFKIIYAKIYDENQGLEDKNYILNFRARKDSMVTKEAIDSLFNEAKEKWSGIFDAGDKIKLRDTHLNIIVSQLQEFSLMGSDLQIIDDTFEYLIPDVAKGKKGQYFTPRHVIDMCVKMMNPVNKEYVIDTACGSGGFLIHTMNHVGLKDKALQSYASKYLWGIDFDERSSKISKAMMIIAGDGKSHIFKENSLDSSSWNSRIKNSFEDENLNTDKSFNNFKFDVMLANPPFAGEVQEALILKQYPNVSKGKKKLSRHLLFIERNLNFVKDGGRLALVLPQGVFNNGSEKYIRDFIAEKARILAVVGLEVNTFKPHTGTKTSVIFLQKWHETLCPKLDDYPIFFATSEKSGKNNSGEYIEYHDEDGKKFVEHDLDEIADAFIDFAKTQNFSFI